MFQHKTNHTQYLRQTSQHWWKEAKVIFLRVFLLTTESYMIITNILKTIDLEEQYIYLYQQHKNLKMVYCFSGSETTDSVNWMARAGAAHGKFGSSDTNERSWQMFTNVGNRKTKNWGLEELKMLFRIVYEKIFITIKYKLTSPRQFTRENSACTILANTKPSTKECYWIPRDVWLCLLLYFYIIQ